MTEWNMRTFSANLRRQLDEFNITQKEFAEKIGVSAPTMCDYLNAKKMPRMDKIQKMADYFGIKKSDLLEDHQYYERDEVAEFTEFLRTNPEYRVLFDASRKVKKEDIELVAQLIKKMGGE